MSCRRDRSGRLDAETRDQRSEIRELNSGTLPPISDLRSPISALLLAASLLSPQLPAQSVRSRAAALDSAVVAGITARTYPAATVIVGRSDTILYSRGYGHYTWASDSRRPDPAWSLWDVASLSKVVATASAVAVLVDRKQLDLDAAVSSLVPRFVGEAKDHVTVRMLLDHTSGLPAWVPLGGDDRSQAGTWGRLFDVGLRREPGQTSLYSDLNAILAARVVEQSTGEPFDLFTRQNVFAPTGMAATTWTPVVADQLRAVPTEYRANGRPLTGVVHDANARAFGGVAGHAGVFATGMDLAHFAQKWLRGLRHADSSWVSPAVLEQFASPQPAAGTRALGWDTPTLNPPDGQPPLYGACATRTTIGHTGFTGTLLWIDTEQDLFVVFLTNRSYQPTRRSLSEMRVHRAAVSDAARRLAGARCP
ncbi:MAG TPA: serine hydrolase domain-containing protein [Gemmatimonadales bacterium]|nr:serine hydrolase domain-containing protein [Gemmatimonadales bacterium]